MRVTGIVCALRGDKRDRWRVEVALNRLSKEELHQLKAGVGRLAVVVEPLEPK